MKFTPQQQLDGIRVVLKTVLEGTKDWPTGRAAGAAVVCRRVLALMDEMAAGAGEELV